jgi:hypothetical protein
VGVSRDGQVYVRRKEDGVVLSMAESVAEPLRLHAALLKPLRVFEFQPRRVRMLRLECDGKRQQLARDLGGSWTLHEPSGSSLGADPAMATELSGALGQLTAVRWLAEDPADAQLQQPWCTIEAEVADDEAPADASKNRKLVLRLGAETQAGYFARHEGSSAAFVAPRRVGTLAKRWLLDRSALLVDPKNVTRVVLEHEGDRVELSRVADRWVAADGAPLPPVAAELDGVLGNLLTEGVVRRGAAAASDGVQSPRLLLTIERKGDGGRRELRIGAGDEWAETRVYYVRASDHDVTFAVAQARLRALLDAL